MVRRFHLFHKKKKTLFASAACSTYNIYSSHAVFRHLRKPAEVKTLETHSRAVSDGITGRLLSLVNIPQVSVQVTLRHEKHVKFLENSDKCRLYHKKSLLPLRPSGLNHMQAGKTNSVFGHKIQRPATVQVSEEDWGIKTIHIPKTITAAPFLQHPGLTPGQKRFLYSIAEAYSKEHMRQLICQHYMNVLHRCIRTVLDANVNLNVKLQLSTYSPQEEHTTNSHSTSTGKTKESGKRSSTSEKVKKTTLPKIVKHQRGSSGFAKSNTIHSRKRRTTIPKHASSRESRPWEDDFEWEATEMDPYLAGHTSGLSFNESEDDDEDFLFLT